MAKKSYSKSKIMRDHELQMAMINAFAKDPELKYFVGMAAGAGVAWVGAMLGQYSSDITKHPNYNPWTRRVEEGYTPSPGATTPEAFALSQIEKEASPFFWLFPGLKPTMDIATKVSSMDLTGGLAGTVQNIFLISGTGFSGACYSILMFKAIFSGTDLGEILQGVGEIIPL